MKRKYGRTYHLPWSEGVTSDDKIIESFDGFIGREVIVSIKMDGENTSIAKNYTHARSLDSRHHWSRSRIKELHGRIGWALPDDLIICGENMLATHSIKYFNLLDYFYVFNIWEKDTCLSWHKTTEYCEILGLVTVPVLYRGLWNEGYIKDLTIDLEQDEGYVVRVADCLERKDFGKKVAKFVRKGHVQESSEHWMNKPETEINLLNTTL